MKTTKNFDFVGKKQTIQTGDKSRKTTHADKYNEITAKIIAQLEQGVIPWRKPWSGDPDAARNYFSGKPYSLLNQMILQKTGYYATFKQWTDHGGKIRKGARAEYVYFFKTQEKETDETDDNGEKKIVSYPVLRCYGVFHESDVEGIELDHSERPDPEKITDAEKIIADYVKNSGVKFTAKISAKAFYRPVFDEIIVPQISQFDETAEYYSTAFHEMTHSTGHQSRLNRDGIKKMTTFGDEDYSREELIAEMGAAYLCSAAGINSAATLKNSAAYIQSWIRALKNDKHMIVWAASRAQKAADFILDMVEISENTDEITETIAPSENSANVSAADYSAAETKTEKSISGAFYKTAAELTAALPEIISKCSAEEIQKTVSDLTASAENHVKNSEIFRDDAEMYTELTEYSEKISAQGDTLNAAEREYRIELMANYRRYKYETEIADRYQKNAEILQKALTQPRTKKPHEQPKKIPDQPKKISEQPKNITLTIKNSVVAFSGALQMARATARQKVTDAGGKWTRDVTRKTTILVVGTYEDFNAPICEKSEKLQKAEKLIADGYKITIIDESAFKQLLANA